MLDPRLMPQRPGLVAKAISPDYAPSSHGARLGQRGCSSRQAEDAAKFGSKRQQLFKAVIVIVDDIVRDLLQADILLTEKDLPGLVHAISLCREFTRLNLLERNELSGGVKIIDVECPDERWQVFRTGRRDFFKFATAAGLVAAAPRTASAAQLSESEAIVAPQPIPQTDADTNTSDIVVGA